MRVPAWVVDTLTGLWLLLAILWIMFAGPARRRKRRGEWWRWYSAYLQSPQWKALRLARVQVARGRCEKCGRSLRTWNGRYRFEGHHRTYKRVGHERLNDVRALCRQCHKRYHR